MYILSAQVFDEQREFGPSVPRMLADYLMSSELHKKVSMSRMVSRTGFGYQESWGKFGLLRLGIAYLIQRLFVDLRACEAW